MGEDFAHPAYSREVRLSHYGENEPFGTYDQETGELTISNERAMGDLTKAEVQSYCDANRRAGTLGSDVLFRVPRKIYELREKERYAWLHIP